MSKRFYARYAGKPGFQEVYEVVDSHTGHPVTPATDYHLANIGAAARNGEAIEHAFVASPIPDAGQWGATAAGYVYTRREQSP